MTKPDDAYYKSRRQFFLGVLLAFLGCVLFANNQVVIPVMEVGDRVLNRLLWDGGAALIPLLGGLFLAGRHLSRYHTRDDAQRREEGSAA